MTEKFYIDTIDGGGSVLTVNGVELGLHETCDLLNEQHETIGELIEELQEQESRKYACIKQAHVLDEENKQLKKSIDCQNKTIKEQCMKIDWTSECGVKWEKEFENWRG